MLSQEHSIGTKRTVKPNPFFNNFLTTDSYRLQHPNYWYSDADINKLLTILVKDSEEANIILAPYDNESFIEVIKRAIGVQEGASNELGTINPNLPSLIPLNISLETKEIVGAYGNHWVALMIKPTSEGKYICSYADPKGRCPSELMEAQLMSIFQEKWERGIQNLSIHQQLNNNDCGAFTVDNLVRLLKGEALRLAANGNAVGLRYEHTRLLQGINERLSNTIYTSLPSEEPEHVFEQLIEEGEIYLNREEIDKAEKNYVAALKLAIRDNDKGKHIICFQGLGNSHLRKKEYTKASALYNAALAICQEASQRAVLINLIKFSEREFLKFIGVKEAEAFVSPYSSDQQHKQFLLNFRETLKEKFKILDKEDNRNKDDEKQQEAIRAKKIRDIYKNISEELKDFICGLLRECYEVLDRPPCRYAIIGLGSFAREEITPYSDFEFMVLIDDERYKGYFHKLTELLHLKILSLGETVLPCMVINVLNAAYPKNFSEDWFFDKFTPNGFKFDGNMPRASKTPLGKRAACNLPEGEKDPNGKLIFELIHTPEKMAEFQKEKWYQDDHLLPNELITTKYIDGDINLLKDYKKEIIKHLKVKSVQEIPLHESRALELLKQDLITFDTNIEDIDFAGKLHNTKKEIYRLPDRILDNLALYFGLEATSGWERIEEMVSRRIITEEAGHNLKTILTIAMELRLRTYLANNKQDETISIITQINPINGLSEEGVQSIFHIPNQAMFLRFYYTILPFYSTLKEFCDSYSPSAASLNIYNRSFYNNSPLIQGLTLVRLLRYNDAKDHFEEALKRSKNGEESASALIQRTQALRYLGYIYNFLREHSKALSIIEEALVIQRGNSSEENIFIAESYNSLSYTYLGLGDYHKALKFLKKALGIKEINLGEDHLDIAHILNNLGVVNDTLGNHIVAQNYYKRALIIRRKLLGDKHPQVASTLNNLGVVLTSRGQYIKARDCFQQALIIKEKIFGEGHPSSAITAHELGHICAKLGQYDKANTYYKKVLNIRKATLGNLHPDVASVMADIANNYIDQMLYPEEALLFLKRALNIIRESLGKEHPECAIKLYNIGRYYGKVGNYDNAYKYLKEAWDIQTKLLHPNHSDLGLTLLELGNIFHEMQEYNIAKTRFQNALNIMLLNFGRKHPTTILIMNNLGNIYKDLNEYELALQYFRDAYSSQLELNENDPFLATILYNTGVVYSIWQQYPAAVLYYQKALELQTKLLRPDHPYLIYTLINLGKAYSLLGEYSKAIDCHTKALSSLDKDEGKGKKHLVEMTRQALKENILKSERQQEEAEIQRALALSLTPINFVADFVSEITNPSSNEKEEDQELAEAIALSLQFSSENTLPTVGKYEKKFEHIDHKVEVEMSKDDSKRDSDHQEEIDYKTYKIYTYLFDIKEIYKQFLNKAIPLSQSLRMGRKEGRQAPINTRDNEDFFSYLTTELTTRILLYLPESKFLHPDTIQGILEILKNNKKISKNEAQELLESPKQLSYVEKIKREREQKVKEEECYSQFVKEQENLEIQNAMDNSIQEVTYISEEELEKFRQEWKKELRR